MEIKYNKNNKHLRAQYSIDFHSICIQTKNSFIETLVFNSTIDR